MSSFEKYLKYKNKYTQLKKSLKNNSVNLMGGGQSYKQVKTQKNGSDYFYKNDDNKFVKVKYTSITVKLEGNAYEIKHYIELYKDDGSLDGIKKLLATTPPFTTPLPLPLYKLVKNTPLYPEMVKIKENEAIVGKKYFMKPNEFLDEVYIPVFLTEIVYSWYGFDHYKLKNEENVTVRDDVIELYDIKQTILPPQEDFKLVDVPPLYDELVKVETPILPPQEEKFRIVDSPIVGNIYYFKLFDDDGKYVYYKTTYGSFDNGKYKSTLHECVSDNLYEK